jgi:hypothetical protein
MDGNQHRQDESQDILVPLNRPRVAPRPAGGRPVCLLTTLHPERSLSHALIQHLHQEMPGVDFTLDTTAPPSAIWVCGYEPGKGEFIRALRTRFPNALLLVTGRGAVEDWCDEVLEAGADQACGWPVPYDRLRAMLRAPRPASITPRTA